MRLDRALTANERRAELCQKARTVRHVANLLDQRTQALHCAGGARHVKSEGRGGRRPTLAWGDATSSRGSAASKSVLKAESHFGTTSLSKLRHRFSFRPKCLARARETTSSISVEMKVSGRPLTSKPPPMAPEHPHYSRDQRRYLRLFPEKPMANGYAGPGAEPK